jgi:hypothetical protein
VERQQSRSKASVQGNHSNDYCWIINKNGIFIPLLAGTTILILAKTARGSCAETITEEIVAI